MKPLYPSELARLTGVSTDTLRYYDRRGLLPNVQRSKAGYRLFPAESLNRVRLVRRAVSIGFSINELADVLGERDRGGAPCQRVRKLAESKLAELDSQLRELRSRRRALRAGDERPRRFVLRAGDRASRHQARPGRPRPLLRQGGFRATVTSSSRRRLPQGRANAIAKLLYQQRVGGSETFWRSRGGNRAALTRTKCVES